MRIGFIGLGNMGLPMAENLQKAGHNVLGFDTASVNIKSVPIARSAKAAITCAEVVITMLPNGRILNAVYDDILESVAKDALMIDCSTVYVEDRKSTRLNSSHT